MMKKYVASVAAVAVFTLPLSAQPKKGPIHLTLQPAAEPMPALKYQLLPDPKDLTPGNAALRYYRAQSSEWSNPLRMPTIQQVVDALEKPIQEVPRQKVAWVLGSKMVQEIDLGARREFCDWEYTPRLKAEGIHMLLPELQGFRQFANILALRARLEMADGHPDKAIYTLQTGMALGRDVANAPMLVNALVGIAIVQITLARVEDFIQTPGAPNLYWALTDLPRPFVPMRRPLVAERITPVPELPLLSGLETAHLSPQQQQELLEQTLHFIQLVQHESPALPGASARGELLIWALKDYPEAKQALMSQGRKREEVEAMPVLQVVLIHSYQKFERLRDNLFKWHDMSYWEAETAMGRAYQEVKEAQQRREAEPFAPLLVLGRVFDAASRVDRRIAALRCIEAIRLHAAHHGGALPATLKEITDVPMPIDPMTGKEFEYRVEGDHATLRSPKDMPLVYELTLKR